MTRIYLDNAASSPMDPEVFEQMKPYLLEHHGNPSSTHAHGRVLRAAIEEARRTIAQCLGAKPGEIYFTSGGTEADNAAITGAVEGYALTHIVTTRIEHHAVTHTAEHLAQQQGLKLTWLPVDATGACELEALEAALKQGPRALVALMHGNNELGTLHDLQTIGEICEAHDALFMSDTVQTMGHFPFHLNELPLHFATASAHKFYGPKGIGFLYIRQGTRIPALLHGGGQERNFRPGTENVASIAGMAYALDKCYRQLETKNAHLRDLKAYLRQRLESEIPGVTFHGLADPERSLPTVLNVAFPCGEEDAMLLFKLDLAGISASGGSACNSGAVTGSHVLQEIGCSPAQNINSVRFSFGPQNTREEIDYLVTKLKEIVTAPVR